MATKSKREIEHGLEFGLTDERSRFDAAIAYRDAAVADGWTPEVDRINPPIEDVAHLEKEGFKMHVMTRDLSTGEKKTWQPEVPYWLYQCSVHIWGPDKLAIRPPDVYNWEAIKSGLTTCNNCGVKGVETQRYSFAGRCCEKCCPEMAAKHARGNWTA